MKKITLIILLLFCQTSFGQNEGLLQRLRAIDNSGTTFFNVDGINFTNQNISSEFNEKNLKKAYRKNKIKKGDIKEISKLLNLENYKVIKKEIFENGLTSISVNYFVKNNDNKISVFWFGYYNKDNPEFERKMIHLIINDQIPKTCFNSMTTDLVNFVGREIELGGNCNWTNINNIQCPYYGQINWSLHKTKQGADLSIQNQLKATKTKKGGRIILEEETNVVFEEVPTKAKKIIYDFTGVKSVLSSISGGENLTIYYISEEVRGYYVSCVLSFWNNDNINPSGLTQLLEEVMSIPEK
ncbi:hypothetical protein N9H19_00360 [Flavobacteriales bacterium]|nr:hypothetical protein [Flavobacteriales bacterium]